MTEKPKAWWRGVRTSETDEQQDNVVRMPRPDLGELERQLIDANNAVISAGIECDRAAMVYREKVEHLTAARARISERLKECGAKVEFPQSFPELE
jgi:hypothetical protein